MDSKHAYAELVSIKALAMEKYAELARSLATGFSIESIPVATRPQIPFGHNEQGQNMAEVENVYAHQFNAICIFAGLSIFNSANIAFERKQNGVTRGTYEGTDVHGEAECLVAALEHFNQLSKVDAFASLIRRAERMAQRSISIPSPSTPTMNAPQSSATTSTPGQQRIDAKWKTAMEIAEAISTTPEEAKQLKMAWDRRDNFYPKPKTRSSGKPNRYDPEEVIDKAIKSGDMRQQDKSDALKVLRD